MLLETKKVTKIFGGLHANSDIDFSIDEGEIVAIIGPNGSGKTTFYNVLTGISPATRGQIIFKGKSIEKNAAGSYYRWHGPYFPEYPSFWKYDSSGKYHYCPPLQKKDRYLGLFNRKSKT